MSAPTLEAGWPAASMALSVVEVEIAETASTATYVFLGPSSSDDEYPGEFTTNIDIQF